MTEAPHAAVISGDEAQEVRHLVGGILGFLSMAGCPPNRRMGTCINAAAFLIAMASVQQPDEPDLKQRMVDLVTKEFPAMVDMWATNYETFKQAQKLAETKPQGTA